MAKIDPDEPCPCGSGMRFADCHGPLVQNPVAPEITQHVSLRLIPPPAPNTAAVFEKTEGADETRFFVGSETGISYDCGECGSSLVAGVPIERFVGIVLRCAKCGRHNLTALAAGSSGPE